MKKNLVIVILVILVLGMGGYLVYDKVIHNDVDKKESNTEKVENSVLKLDNSKDWVYDADYSLPTNKESYYGYSDHTKLISASDLIVPYINIDSDDAKNVNKKIYQLYKNLIDKFNESLKEEICFTLVEYKTYINDNIISIIITTETSGTDVPLYEYYTYSFNLENGNLLSYDDAYEIAGFTKNNINEKASQAITNIMREKNLDSTYFDNYNNKSINDYKTSVDNDTIKFFIDESKNLNIIVKLYIPAGRGEFDTIINVK